MDKIVGLTGDMTNMETMFAIKNLFQKTLNSKSNYMKFVYIIILVADQ